MTMMPSLVLIAVCISLLTGKMADARISLVMTSSITGVIIEDEGRPGDAVELQRWGEVFHCHIQWREGPLI